MTIAAAALVMCLAMAAVAAGAGGSHEVAGGGVKYKTPEGETALAAFAVVQTPRWGVKGSVLRRVVDTDGTVLRTYIGAVDCLSVTGNVARFSGKITKSIGEPDIAGQYFVYAIEDNGEGRRATGPDRIRVMRSNGPVDCTTSQLMPQQPVELGNIQVR